MIYIYYSTFSLLALYLLYILYYKTIGYKNQQRLQFPQSGVFVEKPTIDESIEVVTFAIRDGKVEAWYLPAETRGPGIIIAHGNQGVIDKNLDIAKMLNELGLHVLLVEYPSYGRSTGSLKQENFLNAFTQGFDFLSAKTEVSSVIVYGSSMGGSIAGYLLKNRKPDALILRSCFINFGEFVAKKFFLPKQIINNAFLNKELIASYAGPILVMHGKSDPIVDYSNALALKSVARDVTLVSYEGGHDEPENDELVRQIGLFIEVNELV